MSEDDTKRAELLRKEQAVLKVCLRHPCKVLYEGPRCPACDAQKEFLQLTDEGKR